MSLNSSLGKALASAQRLIRGYRYAVVGVLAIDEKVRCQIHSIPPDVVLDDAELVTRFSKSGGLCL